MRAKLVKRASCFYFLIGLKVMYWGEPLIFL